MSSRHSAQSAPTGQAKSADEQVFDHRSEFYRLGCVLLRFIISAIQSETFQIVQRRFANLARGAYYPESGYGDLDLVAGLSNRTRHAIREQSRRLSVPSKSPGDSLVFQVRDFIQLAPSPAKVYKTRERKGGAK